MGDNGFNRITRIYKKGSKTKKRIIKAVAFIVAVALALVIVFFIIS